MHAILVGLRVYVVCRVGPGALPQAGRWPVAGGCLVRVRARARVRVRDIARVDGEG